MRLFHVSNSEFIIDSFLPFSHFGSFRAAEDRSKSSKLNDGNELRFYEVEFLCSSPVRVKDIADKHRSNNHGLARFIDFLHYDAKLISSKERDVIFTAAAPLAENNEQGFAALSSILKDKGFDSIVYRNDFEDKGSDSWMNISADQVKIISVMSLNEFIDHKKSLRQLVTPDATGFEI